jgi:hypothetical protein
MRTALDPTIHRVPRTKPTCLLHTWRPHRRRPFALVLHLHQHQSRRNMHLQYLAKNQSTQYCQSLITQGSDHPPVLEPHMVLMGPTCQRRAQKEKGGGRLGRRGRAGWATRADLRARARARGKKGRRPGVVCGLKGKKGRGRWAGWAEREKGRGKRGLGFSFF